MITLVQQAHPPPPHNKPNENKAICTHVQEESDASEKPEIEENSCK
jgi:hypothetical protein